MKVKVYNTVNDYVEFETSFKTMKEILSQIRFLFGQELYDKVIYNEYAYAYIKDNELACIGTETFNDTLDLKELFIIPAGEGAEAIGIIAAIIGYAAAGIGISATTAGIILAVVAVVAVLAISLTMSPDQSFGQDPAKDQASKESNLFNSATILNEQGGSVPLIYGNPFCGGVLISSSLTSTDIERP